jgi:hypothetical protein
LIAIYYPKTSKKDDQATGKNFSPQRTSRTAIRIRNHDDKTKADPDSPIRVPNKILSQRLQAETPTHHFNTDPDSDIIFDADPDPDPSFKKGLNP